GRLFFRVLSERRRAKDRCKGCCKKDQAHGRANHGDTLNIPWHALIQDNRFGIMGAMTKAPPVLARVYRGSGVESTHRGSVSVVDERGRMVGSAGDDAAAVYLRSTAKPFQAMPLLLAGGEKRFRLGDAEIALMCASHAGEPRHTRVAEAILKRGGFRTGDLRCGAHAPTSEASARALVASGKEPTPLHNNCSGKHAGLLLACRLLDLPHANYNDPGHPLHKRIKTLLARYADISESAIGFAVDGCNFPVYRIP